jgi:hypothetical protein
MLLPLLRLPESSETVAWVGAGYSPAHSCPSAAGALHPQSASQVSRQFWGLRMPTVGLGMVLGLARVPLVTAACGRVLPEHCAAYDTGRTSRHAPRDIDRAGAVRLKPPELPPAPRSPPHPRPIISRTNPPPHLARLMVCVALPGERAPTPATSLRLHSRPPGYDLPAYPNPTCPDHG